MKLPNKKAAVIGVFAGLFFGVCFLQGAYQSVTDLFSLPFKFSMITSLLMLLLMTAASFWLAAPLHWKIPQTQISAISAGYRHTAGLRDRRAGKSSE